MKLLMSPLRLGSLLSKLNALIINRDLINLPSKRLGSFFLLNSKNWLRQAS